MAPPQVVQWVRQTYPKPRVAEEWLDACCAWLVDDMNINPDTQTDEFITNVEAQLLESNLCESMVDGTGFPLNAMTMNNARIGRTPILVEVTSITEIGHSAFNLHNTRQMRIERADLAGLALEEGAENDEGPIPNYPRTMLKLEVCDGSVTLPAIEYRALPELKLGETPLGFKVWLPSIRD
ncbi:hypothetical protein DFH11DRAFT_1503511 [Phellopilus nigrolimitatus]|nr:hypothetical protein DFH11DRAFT_1503511 [Phellopilus nigrolimitatus]